MNVQVDQITRFVTETMENEAYSPENLSPMGNFTTDHRKSVEDFNQQKKELALAHR